MQTIEAYAEDVAAGDRGRWRSATRRAADLLGPHQLTIDLTQRIPLTQILVQTTALLLYGLAASNSEDPGSVSALVLFRWATERTLPLPPHPDGPMSDSHWVEADRSWRHDLDRAVDRLRHDLAELLRQAGHATPDADVRNLAQYSDDPVVMTWIDLADIDPPDSPARYGVLQQFPLPRLRLVVRPEEAAAIGELGLATLRRLKTGDPAAPAGHRPAAAPAGRCQRRVGFPADPAPAPRHAGRGRASVGALRAARCWAVLPELVSPQLRLVASADVVPWTSTCRSP